MKYLEWEATYRQIVGEFGYSIEADENAAKLLVQMLRPEQRIHDAGGELKRLISGRDAAICGPCVSPAELLDELLSAAPDKDVLMVSVGEGTGTALDAGIVPDILFTDLDGFPERDIEACRLGTIVVLHAHGDNTADLKEWAPRLTRNVVPTCQCRPWSGIFNWGGFTDGDRAFCALEHFKASGIILIGFDFSKVCGSKRTDPSVKMRKLEWARKIIGIE